MLIKASLILSSNIVWSSFPCLGPPLMDCQDVPVSYFFQCRDFHFLFTLADIASFHPFCLYVCLSDCLPFFKAPIYLQICMFIHLLVYLPACLPVRLPFFSVSLSFRFSSLFFYFLRSFFFRLLLIISLPSLLPLQTLLLSFYYLYIPPSHYLFTYYS